MTITLRSDPSPYAYNLKMMSSSIFDIMTSVLGCPNGECSKKVVVWLEQPSGTWNVFDSTRPKELNDLIMTTSPAPSGIYTFYNYTAQPITIDAMTSIETSTTSYLILVGVLVGSYIILKK